MTFDVLIDTTMAECIYIAAITFNVLCICFMIFAVSQTYIYLTAKLDTFIRMKKILDTYDDE